MARAQIIITSDRDRERASRWALQAKPGMRIEFKEAKRSLDQNAKMWACLTDLSFQLPWHGHKLRPDDWKILMLDALKGEKRAVPNIEGTGFVSLGRSSSDLSKDEMSELIELIHMFGTQHGVVFHGEEAAA